jgi:hypothetical protein
MSHFSQRQCDFAINVTKTAILEGLSKEQFIELIETAWNVLTAERESPSPQSGDSNG